MRKGLLVAVCTTVVAVTIVAGFLSVRKINNREAFSDERAYRNAVDLDLRYDDIEDSIAKDPTISGNYQELRDATAEAYKILNNERAAHKLEPLKWDYALEICAQTRAEEISYVFDSGHTRPNGTVWYTVNPGVMLGENIYKGKKSADKVMASWLSNEADKENFLSEDFTKTAICVFSNDKGEYYWVAAFGTELTDITFVNDVQPGEVWILKDTESNRHTSVWGTAMIDAEEPGTEYHPGIPKSSDGKYLFRMIDKDGIYYDADIPELQNGWKVKIYTDDTDVYLDIYDENGELMHKCEVFNAAL